MTADPVLTGEANAKAVLEQEYLRILDEGGEPRGYLRPLLLSRAGSGFVPGLVSLQGGEQGFTAVEVILRAAPGSMGGRGSAGRPPRRMVLSASGLALLVEEAAPLAGLLSGLWDGLTRPLASFAGLDMARPSIMGIVNVTPDSFSDGGRYADTERAVAHGLALMEAGADILDIGGESTRPGSAPVSPEDEIARVVPVIRTLAEKGAVISIDSRNAPTMAAALEAGARIINDVTALTGHPDSLDLVRRTRAPVILMHMQGEPQTMQANPVYDDVSLDVYDALMDWKKAVGSEVDTALDPGIGFGKTLEHNLSLLGDLPLIHASGCPVLLGASRKSFIAHAHRGEAADQRLGGSLAAALTGLACGVQMIRVHDVAETAQAFAVWQGTRVKRDRSGPRA